MREKLRTRWDRSALKAWAEGKFRLSRGKKLVLNLVIIALAGVWLWGLAGYPLPTAEMEFRRLERQSMLPASEILWDTGAEGHGQEARGEVPSWHLLDHWVVGQRDGVLTAAMIEGEGDAFLECYPQGPAPYPVPLANGILSISRAGTLSAAAALAFFGVPEGAVRAELELEPADPVGASGWSGEGWSLGSGRWLFPTRPEGRSSFSGRWYEGGSYVLRLYDGADRLLLEKAGTLPLPL